MNVFKRLGLSGIALALAITLALPASTVLAQSSGGIGGRPANPDPANPRTESIFIYTLDKGASKADQVVISNNTDTKQTIELLAVDGVVTNTGAYTCKQNVEEKTGLGGWISLASSEVTLDPGTKQKVDFTLTMPATADVGEHNGCLVFQSKQDEGEVTGNVRIRTRQAIRVVATVPGELKRSIAIAEFGVKQDGGKQQLLLDVKNTGNVSADVDAKARLSTVFGQQVYENGGGYPVLSNQTLNLSFVNEEQPFFGGWYTAQSTISYDDRAGVFGNTDQGHTKTEESKKVIVFITPHPIAIALYALILLVILGAIIGRIVQKRNRANAFATWQDVQVQTGDTIETLAAKHSVNWKKVATVNKLKAPYTLVAGDTVKLPALAEGMPVETTPVEATPVEAETPEETAVNEEAPETVSEEPTQTESEPVSLEEESHPVTPEKDTSDEVSLETDAPTQQNKDL